MHEERVLGLALSVCGEKAVVNKYGYSVNKHTNLMEREVK